MAKYKFFIFSILFIVFVFFIFVFLKNKVTSEEIVKQAIKIENINHSDNYILVKPVRVTGYFWEEVDKKGSHIRYCNVNEPDTFQELNANYEFIISNNSFVFYTEDTQHEYSETFGETMTTYTVSPNWDILYPVKHESFIDNIVNKKYMISDDLD